MFIVIILSQFQCRESECECASIYQTVSALNQLFHELLPQLISSLLFSRRASSWLQLRAQLQRFSLLSVPQIYSLSFLLCLLSSLWHQAEHGAKKNSPNTSKATQMTRLCSFNGLMNNCRRNPAVAAGVISMRGLTARTGYHPVCPMALIITPIQTATIVTSTLYVLCPGLFFVQLCFSST